MFKRSELCDNLVHCVISIYAGIWTGEIVQISDGLKHDEDDLRYISVDQVDLMSAMHFLFVNGPYASEESRVPLEDIKIGNSPFGKETRKYFTQYSRPFARLVLSMTVEYVAEFEIISSVGDDAVLFFHIHSRHIQCGWNSSPWGHMSRHRECIGDADRCVQSGVNTNSSFGGPLISVSNPDSLYNKIYQQEMDGIRMYL